ncbi:hypothetical protein BDR03DRAFT_963903 [Suillus americanus]|nr:hypothetical protein BDR03DRAFT_963903 [Suillus americanus]
MVRLIIPYCAQCSCVQTLLRYLLTCLHGQRSEPHPSDLRSSCLCSHHKRTDEGALGLLFLISKFMLVCLQIAPFSIHAKHTQSADRHGCYTQLL